MIEKMPDEYKGGNLKKGDYIKNIPRKWTSQEIEWCLGLKEKGYTNAEIAWSIDREVVSVNIKMKRLKKSGNLYNKDHFMEKYYMNDVFLEKIKPKSILDVYCGEKRFYINKAAFVVINDKDSNIKADYNMDSLKLLCKLYHEGWKFDLIDLDPFGSAANCFELAIQMAQKGLVITLGEMGHKRFKRLDYVKRFYDINTLEDFTLSNLILNIQKTGRKFKKDLIVECEKEWKNVARVWFRIEKIKITEQWEGKDV